jgi:hypothetical protein
MSRSSMLKCLVISPLIIAFTACEQLPGDRRTQGAVIGGAAGAATGAVLGGSEHRALGALLGGLLGAGGGYVIAARTDRIEGDDRAGAEAAAQRAQTNPATPQDAMAAATADLNQDGFVTLDEVVAMHQAGLPDEEMLRRLRATDQIFELTPDQERFLMERGISRRVVTEMATINRPADLPATTGGGDVIGQPGIR